MVSIQAEMPRYQCHKIVHALKIKDIECVHTTNTNGELADAHLLIWEDACYAPVIVTQKYIDSHNPQIGGYYVVYEDGYQSYSPAEAFEAGYTRI